MLNYQRVTQKIWITTMAAFLRFRNVGDAAVKWCSKIALEGGFRQTPPSLQLLHIVASTCGKHQTYLPSPHFFFGGFNSSQSNATRDPLQLLVSKCFQPPSSFKQLRLSTILYIEWICIARGQCLATRHRSKNCWQNSMDIFGSFGFSWGVIMVIKYGNWK